MLCGFLKSGTPPPVWANGQGPGLWIIPASDLLNEVELEKEAENSEEAKGE